MKTYWKGIEELRLDKQNVDRQDIHNSNDSILKLLRQNNGNTRRDFLKTFGFSIAGAAILASCERPITKAIPFLIKPDEITPGKSSYYASTFYDGEEYCSILVKVRDGRPIKIEGNELSSINRGKTSAIVQGSVLELYDENRYRDPMIGGEKTSWEKIDGEIKSHLENSTGKSVLLTSSIISPATRRTIADFLDKHENIEHVTYDAVSVSGIRTANDISFGRKVIPAYNFSNAEIILSFGADFLGTWLSPVEFAQQYIQNRKPREGRMSRHIHFESGMSMTGSNADERVSIKPSEEKGIIAQLFAYLAAKKGQSTPKLPSSPVDIEGLAEELLANQDKVLVVSGSNDPETQVLVNGINELLGSYGNTIDLNRPLETKQGDDDTLEKLVQQIDENKISGMIVYNANPAYDYNLPEKFAGALLKMEFSISLANRPDETSTLCKYVCPDHHYLESWSDAMPRNGIYSLGQPAIRHIFNTRQAQESLLLWSGSEKSFHEYIQAYWKENIYPLSDESPNFTAFWNKSLHDGIFEIPYEAGRQPDMDGNAVSEIMNAITSAPGDQVELDLYIPLNIGSGSHANNPWLQETPDSVSKITWDNYAAVSPRFAEDNDIRTGDIIRIDGAHEIPVLIQPGQHYGTISVALGYGRKVGGKASVDIGKNFYPLVQSGNGHRKYSSYIQFEKASGVYDLAATQLHHSMEGRALIREASLEEYKADPAAGNEMHEEIEKHLDSLYDKHAYEGHHWGMSVNLTSCIGCNACVVACISENNIPVVGKEQVKRGREMHWIRIDRYYSGDPEAPEVSRQPVMCQHCDNAPCENVCPVSATTHSTEGINQMIYNRCVGTRYCNNNCPYKVRRFNWLDFNQADAIPKNTYDPMDMSLDLSRMVLNPDVTVRAKGVMEKCSFCIQRIQEKKLEAKLEGRSLRDGEIKSACQQVCPTEAITFGDLNDKNGKLSGLVADERSYHLLEEIHTLPSVSYLSRIRNKSKTT